MIKVSERSLLDIKNGVKKYHVTKDTGFNIGDTIFFYKVSDPYTPYHDLNLIRVITYIDLIGGKTEYSYIEFRETILSPSNDDIFNE